MIVEVVHSSIDPKRLQDLINFCKMVEQTEPDIANNWKVTDWQLTPASLFHVLLIQKRFDTGGLCLLYEDDQIVAVSGFYQSDIHPSIHVFGARAWVLKEKRRNLIVAEHILPIQVQRMIANGADMGIISFTDRTKRFAELIKRTNENFVEGKSVFFFGDRYPSLYRDMTMLDFPVTINHTKQWILIKKFSDFEFDFHQISHT